MERIKQTAVAFQFKNGFPEDITSDFVCKFQCRLCNEPYYDECVKYLNTRIRGYFGNQGTALMAIEK